MRAARAVGGVQEKDGAEGELEDDGKLRDGDGEGGDGKVCGLVEFSFVLPDDMPHYDRDRQ